MKVVSCVTLKSFLVGVVQLTLVNIRQQKDLTDASLSSRMRFNLNFISSFKPRWNITEQTVFNSHFEFILGSKCSKDIFVKIRDQRIKTSMQLQILLQFRSKKKRTAVYGTEGFVAKTVVNHNTFQAESGFSSNSVNIREQKASKTNSDLATNFAPRNKCLSHRKELCYQSFNFRETAGGLGLICTCKCSQKAFELSWRAYLHYGACA